MNQIQIGLEPNILSQVFDFPEAGDNSIMKQPSFIIINFFLRQRERDRTNLVQLPPLPANLYTSQVLENPKEVGWSLTKKKRRRFVLHIQFLTLNPCVLKFGRFQVHCTLLFRRQLFTHAPIEVRNLEETIQVCITSAPQVVHKCLWFSQVTIHKGHCT